jgi:hypothetical protein
MKYTLLTFFLLLLDPELSFRFRLLLFPPRGFYRSDVRANCIESHCVCFDPPWGFVDRSGGELHRIAWRNVSIHRGDFVEGERN